MNQGIPLTTEVIAEALFVSDLSANEPHTPLEISAAAARVLRRAGGGRGCSATFAQLYGDDPDTAPGRMQWALALVRATPAVEQICRSSE